MHPQEGFRPEYLDFQRGIQVGHLETHQRITRILKQSLENRFETEFVTDRYGRGVFWQWICFLSRANRNAKPLSHHTNFGCSKFFISIDREERAFKSGMQVERGYLNPPASRNSWKLQRDWDWHLLVENLKEDTQFCKMLVKLMKGEGFHLKAGSWTNPASFDPKGCPSMNQLFNVLRKIPGDHWGGFQLYYPMSPEEVKGSTGPDLVDAMMAVFVEVTPLMNICMRVQLNLR